MTGRSLGVFCLATAVLSMVLAGCSCSRDRDLSLLESATDAEETPEAERLRKMQMVRVIDPNDGGTEEWSSQEFRQSAMWHCNRDIAASCFNFNDDPDSCGPAECLAAVSYCMAEIYAVAAGVNPRILRLVAPNTAPDASNPPLFTVPPQSNATNAELAYRAAKQFYEAMHWSFYTLDTGLCSLEELKSGRLYGAERRSEFFGATILNSYYGAKGAIDRAVTSTLAVADAQLASTPSTLLATERAVGGAALSRAAAAHMLVGGTQGLPGFTQDIFCGTPRLSAQAKSALEILRESALNPNDVLSDLDMELLLDGILNWGSVRARLSVYWDVEFPPDVPLADYFGLTEDDFAEAREYLAQEIVAFSRTEEVMPDLKFVATAAPPPERDAAYYPALARGYGAADRPTEPLCPTCPLVGWRHYARGPNGQPLISTRLVDELTGGLPGEVSGGLAALVDRAYSWGGYFLSRRADLRDDPTLEADILDPLSLLTSGGEREGRIIHCSSMVIDDVLHDGLMAEGFGANDMLRVVRGEDQLACAVTGTIEGAPCDIAYFGEFANECRRDSGPQECKPEPSFDIDTWFMFPTSNLPPESDPQRWYVIRPRDHGLSGVPPGKGEWEAIIGFVPYTHALASSGTFLCRDIPIVPEAEARAAEVLAPSREWCTGSRTSCAGATFDDRMPLEDELADDDNSVESSWRHYLGLARAAADEADRLGEAYIEAGLQLDLRAEDVSLRKQAQLEKAAAALESLQDICGTSVDIAALLEALGQNADGDLDLSEIDQGACPTSGDLPEGTVCLLGRLITDWLGLANMQDPDPALRSLAECV